MHLELPCHDARRETIGKFELRAWSGRREENHTRWRRRRHVVVDDMAFVVEVIGLREDIQHVGVRAVEAGRGLAVGIARCVTGEDMTIEFAAKRVTPGEPDRVPAGVLTLLPALIFLSLRRA